MVIEQLPRLSSIAIGRLGLIPLRHPLRIVIVIIGAGHKISCALGISKGFAHVPTGNDGAPVFNRDAEYA